MTLFPLWNTFHVLIGAIMLQYHLILIHTLLLAWMIVFIMTKAGTLHAKIILKKKVFLVCIACLATNNNRSVSGSTNGVQKIIKTATKHTK